MARYALRFIALLYLLGLLVIPVGIIGWRTFDYGVGSFFEALTPHSALHAIQVTFVVALWAVALNTVFGIGTAILLVRRDFPGKRLLNALIDLPLAVSPVVVGLALILVYGGGEVADGRRLTARGRHPPAQPPGLTAACDQDPSTSLTSAAWASSRRARMSPAARR